MAQRRRVAHTVLGAFLAIAVSASAAIAAPSFFSTQNECEKAVIAGRYEVYPPRYFGNRGKDPVDGVTRIAAPTEFTACVHMKTMTGKKEWVVQAPGTMLRFHVASDGSLTPYARHDCGNEIDKISYPYLQEAVPNQSNVPAQKADTARVPNKLSKAAQDLVPIRDVCGERRLYGERFVNKIDEYGRPYCEEDIPWYKQSLMQYPVNFAVGAGVGYAKGGELGALIGGLSGVSGTYLGRKIAGKGNEEWGWVGLGTGIIGGALSDFGDGGSTSSTSTLTGPSGGGTGIGEVISSGGGGIP